MLEQLPDSIQMKVYSNVLFCDFLGRFRKFFAILNKESSLKCSLYTP